MQNKPLIMLLLILTAAFPSFIAAQEVNPAEIAETASESVSLETSDEKKNEDPAPPAVEKSLLEPFSGSSIENTQEKLKHIFQTWSSGSATEDKITGLILSESEDRFFRRSCEYLVRACREPVFSAASALIIFQEYCESLPVLNSKAFKMPSGFSMRVLTTRLMIESKFYQV